MLDTDQASSKMKRRLYRGAAAFYLLTSLALLTIPANAQFGSSIVYDPTAVAQLITQVSNQVQMLQNQIQQIQQGEYVLQGLGSDLTPNLSGLTQQTQSLISNLNNIQSSGANLSSLLNSTFPSDYSSYGDVSSILATLAPMLNQVRRAQTQSMALQNQLATNIPQYSTAIQAGVSASNSAAGPTAAVQATNQILAAISAQLADIVTALIADERAQEQREMAQQSQISAADAALQQTLSSSLNYPIVDATNY